MDGDSDVRRRFVELKADGGRLKDIAEELGITVPTAMEWQEELSGEIAKLSADLEQQRLNRSSVVTAPPESWVVTHRYHLLVLGAAAFLPAVAAPVLWAGDSRLLSSRTWGVVVLLASVPLGLGLRHCVPRLVTLFLALGCAGVALLLVKAEFQELDDILPTVLALKATMWLWGALAVWPRSRSQTKNAP